MQTSQISNWPSVCQGRMGVGEGHQEHVITRWPMSTGTGRLFTCFPDWEYEFHLSFLFLEAALKIQPSDSEVVLRLDRVDDWIQLRLYKLSRCDRQREISSSCSHQRHVLHVLASSRAHQTYHLPTYHSLPLPLVSPCPPSMGTNFRFHLGGSWAACKPIVGWVDTDLAMGGLAWREEEQNSFLTNPLCFIHWSKGQERIK